MTAQQIRDLFEYGLMVACLVAGQWALLAGGLAAA
jgi:hypothetical protein